MTCLKAELEKRGFTVIAVYEEIVPGWEDMYSERWGRLELERAIVRAKDAKAVLVAPSVDRFRRSWNPKWRKKQPQPPLNLFEIKRLLDEADGVQLATLIHPDTPPEQVRSEQTKRGQAGKASYGGRPKETKKAKRLRLVPVARALWKKGCSYRRIGRRLKVHWSTVRDWLRGEGKSAHPADGD
jgi:DNA invertase Pin-like site-specific DNA recombinase